MVKVLHQGNLNESKVDYLRDCSIICFGTMQQIRRRVEVQGITIKGCHHQ